MQCPPFVEHLTTSSCVTPQAKENLKILKEAHEEHNENAANLSNELKSISEELDQVKKNSITDANRVTDSKPLVEIRAAIQRLRKENKELDVHIGVLVRNIGG